MTDATRKYFEKIEWSMASGQCPQCEGCKPDVGWWTDTVGHSKDCLLAQAMENYGMTVIWEHLNPERIDDYCIADWGGISFKSEVRNRRMLPTTAVLKKGKWISPLLCSEG